MANRAFKETAQFNGNGKKVISFQILPNGVGTPTIGSNSDKVVSSVSRSGVGVYAITLADQYLAIESIFCQVQLNAAANTFVQLTGSQPVSTTKIINMTILTAGVAADIAANANNILHFTVFFRDSSGQ